MNFSGMPLMKYKVFVFLLPLLLAGCSSNVKKAYSNENNSPVTQGAAMPFQFEVYSEIEIAKIRTYHWNDGKGAPAGEIILTDRPGKVIGKWQAEGKPGRNNVASALWEVEPDIKLKPGIYFISTGNDKSWSHNPESQGIGFTSVYIKE